MPETPRRSDLQRSNDIDQLIQWHLSGFSRQICCALYQSQCGVSRQQASRDFAIAMDTLHKQDEVQTKPDPVTFEVRDATVNLLQLALLKASLREDFDTLAKLSKEIRGHISMGGRSPCTIEPVHKNQFIRSQNNVP